MKYVNFNLFMGEMNKPYSSKRGGKFIYILQFLQIGFIYKTLISLSLNT